MAKLVDATGLGPVASNGVGVRVPLLAPDGCGSLTEQPKGRCMANVKKGNLTAPPEWWKHLKWMKRPFWKSERAAHKADVRRQLAER
jgi:hypothetical protein